MRKFLLLLALLFSEKIYGQLTSSETKDMRLVSYDLGHQDLLQHTGRCFHSALAFHKKLFDYKPSEKITVLIQDFGDFGNGGATAVPKNAITVGLSPFSYTFETSPAAERIFSMMNHELVHVVALDNASQTDRFYRKLFFGKVAPSKENPLTAVYGALTTPRRYSPRWYHEGIASYVETWMSGGVGLALGNYDEMVFRTRVLEGAHIYSAQGLESEGTTTDFQGKSNSYLYGTRFMGYLSFQYGPDKIIEWVKRKDGSKRSYSTQFKHIFGKNLTEGWEDWIRFEKDWQKKNLEDLKQFPVTQTQPITEKILGSVSYPYYDKKRNKIYVAINYPGQVPHIAAIHLKDGRIEKLTDIKGAALFYVSSLTYHEESDMIYFTTDNDSWRDLNSYDLQTGKVVSLQKDDFKEQDDYVKKEGFRTGDLAFNKVDKTIWGIRHKNGYSTIVRIPLQNSGTASTKNYSEWKQIYTLPYGQDIFDIDISPDGKQLSAAVSDYKGNQSLMFYDINNFRKDNSVPDTLISFDVSSPQSFRYTKNGKYLYGCSYSSGVSNIYQVDATTKEIKTFSNALTGLFRPLEINDSTLLAFKFTSTGFQPVYINSTPMDVSPIKFLGDATIDKFPILNDWELSIPTSKEINLDSLTISKGKYEAGKLMKINSAYPVLTGYKNFVGIGYTVNLGDPLSIKELELSVAYTPKSWVNAIASKSDSTNMSMDAGEQFHFAVSGKMKKYTFSATHNQANFYDLFGPTKTSRKGTTARVDFTKPLLSDAPKKLDFNFGVGAFYGLQKSPFFQQIETQGFGDSLFVNFDGSLFYSNLRSSLGAVDAEKGVKGTLRSMSAVSNGKVYSNVLGSFDLGFQLPVNHMSLWFRTAFGNSFSEAFNPFTRYGFAAFGNNYVDYQVARRYRNTFSFPGLSFDADRSVIARSFAKAMMELALPPIRFKELGGLNMYSNWMQATLFSSGLLTHDKTSPDSRFVNIGTQIDMKIVIFSLLESTFSIGYANAFDLNNNTKRYQEWMISLKLLR